MSSVIQLLFIALALTTVFGNILEVTNGTHDYFLLSQREFLHQIEIAELQIAAVDARSADRLNVISYQQQQVLGEIQQANRTLMPLQAMSVRRKYCIQKYDSQLITHSKAQEQLDDCYNVAVELGVSLTTVSRDTIMFTKRYVTVELPRNVASCNMKNQTESEQCYIRQVELATDRVNDDLKQVENQLNLSLYNADVTVRDAVDCSFEVEKNVLESIGASTKQIDVCEISERSPVQNLIMGTFYKP